MQLTSRWRRYRDIEATPDHEKKSKVFATDLLRKPCSDRLIPKQALTIFSWMWNLLYSNKCGCQTDLGWLGIVAAVALGSHMDTSFHILDQHRRSFCATIVETIAEVTLIGTDTLLEMRHRQQAIM